MKTILTFVMTLAMATAFAAAPAPQTDKAKAEAAKKAQAEAAKKAKAKAEAERKAKIEAEKKARALAEARRKAHAACVKAANDRLSKMIQDLNSRKRRAGTAEIVKAIDDFVAKDPDATNAEVRAYATYAYFDMCSKRSSRFGRRFGSFDAKLAAATTERIAKGVLNDAKAGKGAKLQAADYYCTMLANDERYAEAERIAKQVATMEDKDINCNASAWSLLMRVYRWWDKPDEMLEAGRQMCTCNRHHMGALASALYDLDRYPAAFALWKEFSTELDEMQFYYDGQKGRVVYADTRYNKELRARAIAFVKGGEATAAQRFMAAVRFGFIGADNEEGEAVRAAFKDCDFTSKEFRRLNQGYVIGPINSAYINGNYPFFTRLVEMYSALEGQFVAPKTRLAYAMSLAYQGRDKEALAAIAKDRANEKLTPIEAAKFDVVRAVIEKKDAWAVVSKLDLPTKEKLSVAVLPAQFALNLKRNDECRRYAEAYQKLFKAIPHRSVDVPWFDRVKTIADWMKIRPQLKSTFVDIKMYGDLENLVTDVATGRGEVKIGEAEGKLKIEITQLCDVEGLHLFMAVKDKNARLVEQGFAGGFGNEMYFAPGANQPYICFGMGPHSGLEYTFQTAYTSFDHTRLDKPTGELDPDALRSETAFFDEEYVYHLIFPWRAFYQKLPIAPGTAWKFDCLCWGNGCSWGGSQGVHEASSWGDLVFHLTPAQVVAIRRKIICDTFRSWNRAEEGEVETFDRWADEVIGDPEFYKTCLKPLEDELKGYAARVKADMTDADVNEIYAKGAQRWLGLKYEIDLLRRNYLTKKNINQEASSSK